jgi:uncharacterized membrane protein
MEGTIWVLAASAAFVGTHFLLSHPLRGPLVATVGEGPFLGIYSLVAALTLAWIVLAYRATPASGLLWSPGNALWAVVTLLMLVASILLMGSLVRNPALPNPGAPGKLPDAARGVYAVTRHPMLWAFAIWGCCHILIYPVAKNIIVAGAMIVLSLVGAALQDQKKMRLQPDLWRAWAQQTSYVPFAAIAAGRARFGGFGAHALLGGLVVWLVATWAHIPLAGWRAGIWRWLG